MKKKKLLIALIFLFLAAFIIIANTSYTYAALASKVVSSDYSSISDDSLYDESVRVNNLVGATITILQIVGLFSAIGIFFTNIIQYIILRHKSLKELNNNELTAEQKKDIEDKLNKKLTSVIAFIVLSVFIYAFSGLLGIVKSYKPIIYIYPTEETNLSVTLGYKDKITSSYPKYIDGWNVLAKPDGSLVDLNSNKNLYALYYENNNSYNFKVKKDGFIVKGTDVEKFLEEKLTILGLNDKEREEFIIYWLPQLENNSYNYIRFATEEEINQNMPLSISQTPDSLIRVLMTYKPILIPFNVEEQKLETPDRNGFVVVEWGGTKIK